jgi:hypothetical protein
MKTTNHQQIENLPFADYLQINRISFSSLKDFKPLTITPAMDLGTKVHNYLLEPETYDYSRHHEVVTIAKELKPIIGEAIRLGKPELTALADFEHSGMRLKFKGRIDIYLDMVIDLKISSMPLNATLAYFRYDRQVTGYMLATGATKGMIISYNKASKRVEMQMINPDYEFWKVQTLKYGEPI